MGEESFLRRNKRCLLVYHSARGDRVEFMRWNTGAVLPARAKDNMHSSEVDYFKAYSATVSRYLDRCKLDLTAVRAPCVSARPLLLCSCLRRADSGGGRGALTPPLTPRPAPHTLTPSSSQTPLLSARLPRATNRA